MHCATSVTIFDYEFPNCYWHPAARAAHVEERLSASQRGSEPREAAAAVAAQPSAEMADNMATSTEPLLATASLSSVPPDVLQQIDAEAGEGQRRPFRSQQDETGARAPLSAACACTAPNARTMACIWRVIRGSELSAVAESAPTVHSSVCDFRLVRDRRAWRQPRR